MELVDQFSYALRRDMLLHVARREIGDRRPARKPDRQRLRDRLLPRLDPVEDPRGTAARLVGGDHPVPAHRDPYRLLVRPTLDHIHLCARGIDPDTEPREVPVPEHRVLIGHCHIKWCWT